MTAILDFPPDTGRAVHAQRRTLDWKAACAETGHAFTKQPAVALRGTMLQRGRRVSIGLSVNEINGLSPVSAWLVGITVASTVFALVGFPVLFGAAMFVGHRPSAEVWSKVAFFVAVITVLCSTGLLALTVRRALGSR